LIYLQCNKCKRYWEDLKYCPYKKIFLPKDRCEEFEEENVEEEEYVNREEIV